MKLTYFSLNKITYLLERRFLTCKYQIFHSGMVGHLSRLNIWKLRRNYVEIWYGNCKKTVIFEKTKKISKQWV